MGRTTFAVLIVLGLAFSLTGEAVAPPPQPLHKVGDHWTPYEPPTEFPPGSQTYVIVPGDTLWDLAKKFWGDPYLWPQLWEVNQYIRDSHWIYPGDPMLVPPKPGEVAPAAEAAPAAAPVPEATGAGAEAAAEGVPPEGEGEPALSLFAAGSEDDIYCFGYLDEKGEELPLSITGSEETETRYTLVSGDIVYVSGGDAEGVKAGQEYFVIEPGAEVVHPATRARLGRMMRYVGQLRVLCTQEHSATAEITLACDAIVVGDRLKPFEPIPIPMSVASPPTTRCDVPNDKAKGTIVYTRDGLEAVGQDHVVLVDLGEADQATPGALLTVYRDNPAPNVPRLVLGEAAVLTAGDHWATAKLTRSAQPIRVGDRVEVK